MQVSTILGSVLPEQRREGEWIEGVAIWVAVLIVVSVGEQAAGPAAAAGEGGDCRWVLAAAGCAGRKPGATHARTAAARRAQQARRTPNSRPQPPPLPAR
jgi:hypothetical protein